MNRYRKKPVAIEAMAFDRSTFDELEKFTGGKAYKIAIPKGLGLKAICYIDTLEGVMTASEGDYIIKGIQGEFYPCKPNIFEQTYDKV